MATDVDEFLTDTAGLTDAELGVFTRLIMAMWRARGSLPNDDAELARIARKTTKKWAQIKPKLMPLLVVRGDRITYESLAYQYDYVKAKSEKNARNARRKPLKTQKPGAANAERSLSTYTDTYTHTDTPEESPTKRDIDAESVKEGAPSQNAACWPTANDDPTPFDPSKPLAGATDKAA